MPTRRPSSPISSNGVALWWALDRHLSGELKHGIGTACVLRQPEEYRISSQPVIIRRSIRLQMRCHAPRDRCH